MKLGAGTSKPERVLGLHFFNPVPVLPLVEVVRSIMTGDEALARARSFAEDTLGKVCIDSQDRAGFVVNALLVPYLLSAIRMYESGFASKEDIDEGMMKGCAHPMGPLALSDLIGLDTLLAVSQSLYEEFRDPASVAPALLNRMVEAGLLGRKSGRGFYDYSEVACALGRFGCGARAVGARRSRRDRRAPRERRALRMVGRLRSPMRGPDAEPASPAARPSSMPEVHARRGAGARSAQDRRVARDDLPVARCFDHTSVSRNTFDRLPSSRVAICE